MSEITEISFPVEPIIIEIPPEGQDGRSATPRGAWDEEAEYIALDIVSYEGSSYMATGTVPVGTLPTDSEYWMLSAEQGEQGEQGDPGDPGQAATIAVGTVTTLPAGSSATVENSGTSSAAVFNFGIPQGEKGDPGVNTWGSITGDLADQTDLQNALDLKANAADVYTQAELDGIFDGIDNALNTKADADNVYTKAQTDTALASKANASDVYDKTAVDGRLDTKADIIHSTASGSIVSITDGAAYPVDSLAVAVEPVQDLHGYDAPWPAGGGKNLALVDSTHVSAEQNCTYTFVNNGFTAKSTANYGRVGFTWPVTEGETYTISYTASHSDGASQYPRLIYSTEDATWTTTGTGYLSHQTFTTTETRYTYTFTATSSGIIFVGAYIGTTTYGATLTVKDFMIEKASSASSFAPYSNVCPISGHTQAVVTRTGRNLFNLKSYSSSSGNGITWTVNADETLSIENTATSQANFYFAGASSVYVDMGLSTGTYTFTIFSNNTTPSSGFQWYLIKEGGTQLIGEIVNATEQSKTVFIDATEKYRFFLRVLANTSMNKTVRLQIEASSTAHPFEKYQGISLTIPFGQTVYGATLDVLTGTLTVDRAIVDLGDLSWSAHTAGDHIYRATVTGMVIPSSADTPGIISSAYKLSSTSVVSSMDNCSMLRSTQVERIFVRDTRYETANAFETGVEGVKLVYPLATPTAIQLTAQQMSLLLGQNAVWASTGDTSVGYRADTKRYIDGKLSALKAELQALILENN